MKRFLLIVAGMLCGLALVVFTQGRLGHIRALAPDKVPGWAAPIENGATLWRGKARGLHAMGAPVETDLNWRFARFGAPGAIWNLTAKAPGLEGHAALGLPLAYDRAEVRDGRIETVLGELPALVEGLDLDGLVDIGGLRADLTLPEQSLRSLGAAIRWTGARINGQEVGTGEMSVVSDQGGGWRAPFDLDGDVIGVTGTLEGRFGNPIAVLNMRIEDAGAMPLDWQEALGRVAQKDGTAWVVRRDLDLSLGWPLL